MNRIRLLSEQVANQIAAGEVVERPASVVKELVENALDAAASRITVDVQAGGRSLIRVTDDGTGMSRDDALLCLERHATSKIQRAEDLSAIATMGFRGEALPSIASVSRMTLTTRERHHDPSGATQVVINGGKLLEVKAAGSPSGTTVEVRQLFFNLPARRKFLRHEETESSHIHHYLTLAALAHPEVAFTFTKDGQVIWNLPGVKAQNRFAALRERIRALFGDEQTLLAVDFSAELSEPSQSEGNDSASDPTGQTPDRPSASSRLALWGFIGAPGVSRSSRQDQHIFVNRRPVVNQGLNFALLEGYHTSLMRGRYPVCCLFLEVDPATVDVNIHPAKREVKFHNERVVRQLVAQAVRQTLLQFHTAPASTPASATVSPAPPSLHRPPPGATNSPGAPLLSTGHESSSLTSTSDPKPPVPWEIAPSQLPLAAPAKPALEVISQPIFNPPPPASRAEHASLPSETAPSPILPLPSPAYQEPTPLLRVPLRLVGVISKLYVVLESDRGLVLLDQHAAHERILFEQMLARLESGQVPSQRLLLPETVELSVRDAQFLREQLPALTRLGVGLSEFGERTFLLDGLPPMVKAPDVRRFVRELVDALKATGEEVNLQRLSEQTIVKTVCRHAVKSNDPLTGPELENLVNDLRHCAMPYTCPHGRPTLIEMNFRELEKKFGRAQS